MKTTRIPVFCKAALLGLSVLLGPQGAAQNGQSGLASAADCAETLLQALDDPSLTQWERIALLDKALLDSLNNFDPCQSADVNNESVSGGVQGAQGASGTQGTQGVQGAPEATTETGAQSTESVTENSPASETPTSAQSTTGSVTESTPSGDIQGSLSATPETPTGTQSTAGSASESTPSGDIQGTLPATDPSPPDKPTDSGQEAVAANETNSRERVGTGTNGTLPEDIPPAENDDIIAKQFRQAALEETDPVARAKLWNEYRRYKNLPEQAPPET